MTLSRTLTAVLLLLAAALACAADPAPDPELRDVLRKAASDSPSFTDRFDAEVWLTDMSARLARQVKNPEERIELLTLVHMEAKRVELPPELILAVIEVESNFDRFAISVAGARGLMQIMPSTASELGVSDPTDPEQNIRAGSRYLKRIWIQSGTAALPFSASATRIN